MSDVQCVRCKHFSFRAVEPRIARQEHGKCLLESNKLLVRGALVRHDCERFDEADYETARKRLNWLGGTDDLGD